MPIAKQANKAPIDMIKQISQPPPETTGLKKFGSVVVTREKMSPEFKSSEGSISMEPENFEKVIINAEQF